MIVAKIDKFSFNAAFSRFLNKSQLKSLSRSPDVIDNLTITQIFLPLRFHPNPVTGQFGEGQFGYDNSETDNSEKD